MHAAAQELVLSDNAISSLQGLSGCAASIEVRRKQHVARGCVFDGSCLFFSAPARTRTTMHPCMRVSVHCLPPPHPTPPAARWRRPVPPVQIVDLSANKLASLSAVPERLPHLHECLLRANAISDVGPVARAAPALDTLVRRDDRRTGAVSPALRTRDCEGGPTCVHACAQAGLCGFQQARGCGARPVWRRALRLCGKDAGALLLTWHHVLLGCRM